MTKEITKEDIKIKGKAKKEILHELVLINDDYHTFEYVIEALVAICDHTEEQATQCAMITHYKGKCDVKKGTKSELRPLRRALVEKDLKAIIN